MLTQRLIDHVEADLGEDLSYLRDGGGEVTAARNVIRGAEPVARFLAGVAQKAGPATVHPAWVNGTPGVVFTQAEHTAAVLTVALDAAGRIQRIFIVLSPRKLRRV
jgi:RNA polymerase sigma-70 factor (ECF subfamily)